MDSFFSAIDDLFLLHMKKVCLSFFEKHTFFSALTEQMFYVLLSLRGERHGYGIMQAITELTGGRVSVGAGTLYALLERFEKDGLIRRTRTEDNRKYYILMPEGERTLQNEYERIKKQAADMERVLQKEEES